MKRFLKIAGIVLAGLVIVVVGAVIVLPHVVDANAYRGPIERLVQDRTGRRLEIKGNLHLSVFPWIGLEVGAMRLANAPGFGSAPFATLQSADIRVRLLPLLAGRVEAGAVSVDGLDLHLARNAKGVGNWQDLVRNASSESRREKARTQASKGLALPITSLSVRSLQIRKASLEWRDARSGRHFRLQDLHLRTGRIATGKPFQTELGFDFQGTKPKLALHALLSGQVTLNPAAQRYRIAGARVSADMSGAQIPGGRQTLKGSFDAVADLGQGTASVTGLKLKLADLALDGAVSAADLRDRPKVSGRITLPQFSPRKVMHELGLKVPATRDSAVLQHASLDTGFDLAKGRMLLHNIALRLDDTHLSGQIEASTAGRVPDVTGDLKVDQLDLDHYLPPAKKQAKASPDPSSPAALPLAVLDKVNGKLRLRIGRLVAHNVHLTDVNATVQIHNRALRLQPLDAKLYGGTLTGDVHVDNRRPGKPAFAVDATLKGVKTGVLLKDAMGKPYVTGMGTIRTALTATGATPKALTRELNGTVRLDLSNGTIYGVDLLQRLRAAWLAHRGAQAPSTTGAGESTGYANLGGTLRIRNGVAHNNDLLMTSPLLHVTGSGQANLVSRRIDYTANVKVLSTGTGSGDKILGNFKGQAVPVSITGPLASPTIRPDLRAMFESKAKEKVQEKKQELEQKLRQKLQDLFK